MRSIEWLCCRWHRVTLSTLNHLNSYFCTALCNFVIGDRKDYKFDVMVDCASRSLRTTNSLWLGRCPVMWPIAKFLGSNHITGTAEPKVVIFCTRVGNINYMQQDDISPTKGRGYGHVTFLKFCRLSLCSATRGFVNDSWATCSRSDWHYLLYIQM